MGKKIFENLDFQIDPHWIVKEFFNSIYRQGDFLWALPFMIEKKGCGLNEEYCFFPDLNDLHPSYHFSGVKFGIMEDEVTITDEQCEFYLRQACKRYLQKNPEDRVKIDRIFENAKV